MAEKTWTQIEYDRNAIRLVMNPGAPEERVAWVAQAGQDRQIANAVAKTRAKHPDVRLAWRMTDGSLVPVMA